MIVFINNKEVVIFKGATIQDVIRAYSMHSYRQLKSGCFAVYDRFGFLTEPDGPAIEGQHFYLKVRHTHN